MSHHRYQPESQCRVSRAVAHLTFGRGARYCLGAPLARIGLQAVFSQLVPRFPAMRLEQLTFNRDTLASGLAGSP